MNFFFIQLENTTNLQELHDILDSPTLSNRFDNGISRPSSSYTLDDKENLVKLFCLQNTIICRKAEVDQLIEGLNEFGLLDVMRKYPEKGYEMFIQTEISKLTADKLIDLFKVQLSPSGSNRNAMEEQVLIWWYDYLLDVEGKLFNLKLCFDAQMEE